MVVKLSGWDKEHTKVVAQACLSALKQLILSDKELIGLQLNYILHAFFPLLFGSKNSKLCPSTPDFAVFLSFVVLTNCLDMCVT